MFSQPGGQVQLLTLSPNKVVFQDGDQQQLLQINMRDQPPQEDGETLHLTQSNKGAQEEVAGDLVQAAEEEIEEQEAQDGGMIEIIAPDSTIERGMRGLETEITEEEEISETEEREEIEEVEEALEEAEDVEVTEIISGIKADSVIKTPIKAEVDGVISEMRVPQEDGDEPPLEEEMNQAEEGGVEDKAPKIINSEKKIEMSLDGEVDQAKEISLKKKQVPGEEHNPSNQAAGVEANLNSQAEAGEEANLNSPAAAGEEINLPNQLGGVEINQSHQAAGEEINHSNQEAGEKIKLNPKKDGEEEMNPSLEKDHGRAQEDKGREDMEATGSKRDMKMTEEEMDGAEEEAETEEDLEEEMTVEEEDLEAEEEETSEVVGVVISVEEEVVTSEEEEMEIFVEDEEEEEETLEEEEVEEEEIATEIKDLEEGEVEDGSQMTEPRTADGEENLNQEVELAGEENPKQQVEPAGKEARVVADGVKINPSEKKHLRTQDGEVTTNLKKAAGVAA